MKKHALLILILFIIVPPISSYPETIKLKNGQIMESKITKKNNKYITVDFYGVTLTYYLDEIESIDGNPIYTSAQLPSMPNSEEKPARQLLVADPLEDYVKFKEEKYYILDKQNFSKISCRISSSALNAEITKAKEIILRKNLQNNLQINTDLEKFTLAYSRGVGLKINKPVIDFKVIPGQGVTDQECFTVVPLAKMGCEQQVNALEQTLESVFAELMLPDISGVKITSFAKTADSVKVTLENKGSIGEQIYTGNTRVSNFSAEQVKWRQNEEFKDIDGHLFLVKAAAEITAQNMHMNVVTLITYQKIGGILFPEKISSHIFSNINGSEQKGDTDILLQNCSVE